MEKKSVPNTLQKLVRKTLHRIQELEKEVLNLKVRGECSLQLEGLVAAYRRVLEVCFEIFEWEDPG